MKKAMVEGDMWLKLALVGALVIPIVTGAFPSMAAAPSAAVSKAPQASGYSACREAALAYDDALKEMAALKAEGFLDDSAPRATMRAADSTAWAVSAQGDLALMTAAHCVLPDLPVSRDVYYGSAMDCHLAKDETEIKAKCARSGWTPGPRWSAAKRPQS